MRSDSKKRLSLSKKGEELIEHYKNMVDHGYQRADGIYVKKHNKNLKYSSICKLWYAKEDNEKFIVWKADTKILNKLPTYINLN